MLCGSSSLFVCFLTVVRHTAILGKQGGSELGRVRCEAYWEGGRWKPGCCLWPVLAMVMEYQQLL